MIHIQENFRKQIRNGLCYYIGYILKYNYVSAHSKQLNYANKGAHNMNYHVGLCNLSHEICVIEMAFWVHKLSFVVVGNTW